MPNDSEVKNTASQSSVFLGKQRRIVNEFRAIEQKRIKGENLAQAEYTDVLKNAHKNAKEQGIYCKNILDAHSQNRSDCANKIATSLDLKMERTNFLMSPSPNCIPWQEFEKINQLLKLDFKQLEYTYNVYIKYIKKQSDLQIARGIIIFWILFIGVSASPIIFPWISKDNFKNTPYLLGLAAGVLIISGGIALVTRLRWLIAEKKIRSTHDLCPECGSTYKKSERNCPSCKHLVRFLEID